jgi:hypothetical protein
MTALIGDQYTYTHPDGSGFGEMALGQPLTAEMKELDMADGTVITVEGIQDDGWPIVNWIDSKGINRMTTVNDLDFDMYFQPVSGGES